jgi:signal transduction histidine kinase
MTPYPERVLQQAYAWTRSHPRVADGVLALLLFAAGAGQVPASPLPAAGAIVVSLVLAGTVTIRRRSPVPAFATALAMIAIQLAYGLGPASKPGLSPGVTDAAIVILLYTLAAYRPRKTSLIALGICLAGAAIAIAGYAPLHGPDRGNILLLTAAAVGVTLVAAWVTGDAVAYRRSYYVSLEERLAVAERARDLAAKRAHAIDASAARLRRIERDLHDGAQVRLAALALTLGDLKETLEQNDTGRALTLARSAHQNAKDTLTELRDLARGIHPPVLDRGLAPALSALAQASAIPVTVAVSLADRPSPAIEAIAYFCTAELLANAAKHSSADGIAVTVAPSGTSGLLLTVTDNGTGGAGFVPGGGLAGLAERVQTVDGTLIVSSPPGGPTIVSIELPEHA